jgi:hypothetical protein
VAAPSAALPFFFVPFSATWIIIQPRYIRSDASTLARIVFEELVVNVN